MLIALRKHWELCVGWGLVAALLLVLVPAACTTQQDAVARTLCQSNFKQLAQRLSIYAEENRDVYPTIQQHAGPDCTGPNHSVMMFDGPSMYPEYLEDWKMLVCPEAMDPAKAEAEGLWTAGGAIAPCLFDNSSYFYFGWAVAPEGSPAAQGSRYAEGIRQLLESASPAAFAADFDGVGPETGPFTLYRLRPRLDATAIDVGFQIEAVPVMMDMFRSLAKMEQFNHSPGGSNVLYLDGHVEFMRYNPSGQAYPMVEALGETMALLRREQQRQQPE
ncbi:MAG: hypothetical protein IT368_07375 [Candidatus Hydrogenedentes bacterium]|nr:hypothetical protein [Candidatus Hydrogenedentota bacterium]